MTPLPVITGFGGINAAGRSSFHHGFMRLVFDALPDSGQTLVLDSLAALTGKAGAALTPDLRASLLERSLIREIEPLYFDTAHVPFQSRADLRPGDAPLTWRMRRRELPSPLPTHWQCADIDADMVEITALDHVSVLLPTDQPSRVRAAGQLPSGFDPAEKYPAKHHPRGLQLAIYAASDAIRSVGIDWSVVMGSVRPEQVAIYASSAMGQLDEYGAGGMMQYPMTGRRTTSKQCPFGLAEMPADFVNAYVLGGVGPTGGLLGACATFLYNLEKAVQDIRSGRVRVALVGAAEAPILPEIIEGYRVMGALAQDEDLLALEGGSSATDNNGKPTGKPDYRRACRPFSTNCGFTLGESAQFAVLMAGDLALELGAHLMGSVPGVFVHGDGYKKSISAPGIGNYLTLGRACSLAGSLLGDAGLRQHTLLHAHGTGTPQNRVTESHVFDKVAEAFAIRDWSVAATKCFTGHSLGPAAGDQLGFALGSLATGRVPGIVTVDHFADDVHKGRLALSMKHRQESSDHWQGVFINSKGFGGNNATGLVLSPGITRRLLAQQTGAAAMVRHDRLEDIVLETRQRVEQDLLRGEDKAIYRFGQDVVDGEDLDISRDSIRVPGRSQRVSLDADNPWGRA